MDNPFRTKSTHMHIILPALAEDSEMNKDEGPSAESSNAKSGSHQTTAAEIHTHTSFGEQSGSKRELAPKDGESDHDSMPDLQDASEDEHESERGPIYGPLTKEDTQFTQSLRDVSSWLRESQNTYVYAHIRPTHPADTCEWEKALKALDEAKKHFTTRK